MKKDEEKKESGTKKFPVKVAKTSLGEEDRKEEKTALSGRFVRRKERENGRTDGKGKGNGRMKSGEDRKRIGLLPSILSLSRWSSLFPSVSGSIANAC